MPQEYSIPTAECRGLAFEPVAQIVETTAAGLPWTRRPVLLRFMQRFGNIPRIPPWQMLHKVVHAQSEMLRLCRPNPQCQKCVRLFFGQPRLQATIRCTNPPNFHRRRYFRTIATLANTRKKFVQLGLNGGVRFQNTCRNNRPCKMPT